MSDQTTQAAPEAQAEPVQLQIQDLLMAAQIIQLASQRGAVKPEEFTAVGALYERLVKFLQQSGAIQPNGEKPADQSSAA
jgi:hypothetical protein